MNFVEKKKAARFILELDDGELLNLDYLLQQNSLREKWINEIKTYKSRGKTSYTSCISNKNRSDVKELTQKLNSIVNELNDGYESKSLLPIDETRGVSQETLNN